MKRMFASAALATGVASVVLASDTLEGMCKELGVPLLVDGTTAAAVPGPGQFRFAGRFPIRGFADGATVHSSVPIPAGVQDPGQDRTSG